MKSAPGYADLERELLRDYRINRRRSLATLEQVRLPHLRAAFGPLAAVAITPLRIRRYVDSRLSAGAAPASVNRELAALRRMLTLGVQLELIDRAPHITMLTEAPPREGFVDSEQFARLLAALPAHLRDPVAFCYYSSWRIGEVRALTWDCVRDDQIVLAAAHSKNGKPRVLPLRGELARIVERAEIINIADPCGGRAPLFALTNLRRAWTSAAIAAGLPGLLIHDLRRSAIRNFVRAGVPEGVAMRLSGHRTRSVFERYNIVSTADLESAIAKVA